jgi:hypothetical protein
MVKKINSKMEMGGITNKQIFKAQIEDLKNIQNELNKYKKYGIKEKEYILVCCNLSYDFTIIKDKQFLLLYIDKIAQINPENYKKNIYIIKDKNDIEFKKKFKLKIEGEEDNKDEDINELVIEEVDKKVDDKKEDGIKEIDKKRRSYNRRG